MNFDNYRVVHVPVGTRGAGCHNCIFQYRGVCNGYSPEGSPLGCFKTLRSRHPELADQFLRRAIWFHWLPAAHTILED